MVKKNGVCIIKILTDVWSNQDNGTVHGYHYFEDESGEWIYNIDFHLDGCFAPVQLKLQKRIPIATAIKNARKVFENTRYCQQPLWND